MGLFVLSRKEYLSCHLEVDSCLHADAGVYKVTVENKLGSASATINVKVIGNQLQKCCRRWSPELTKF